MNTRKVTAFFVYYGLYVVFVSAYIVFFGYIFSPIMDWVIQFAKPFSWFIRFLIFLCFGMFSIPILLIGGLPLFWLDSFKRERRGWIGSLINELERKN